MTEITKLQNSSVCVQSFNITLFSPQERERYEREKRDREMRGRESSSGGGGGGGGEAGSSASGADKGPRH